VARAGPSPPPRAYREPPPTPDLRKEECDPPDRLELPAPRLEDRAELLVDLLRDVFHAGREIRVTVQPSVNHRNEVMFPTFDEDLAFAELERAHHLVRGLGERVPHEILDNLEHRDEHVLVLAGDDPRAPVREKNSAMVCDEYLADNRGGTTTPPRDEDRCVGDPQRRQ